MKCPKCNSKFRVANTASNDPDTNRYYLRNLVSGILSWYTDDFVVRQRVCEKCSYTSVTLEIERKDFIDIVNIVEKEGIPECLKKK